MTSRKPGQGVKPSKKVNASNAKGAPAPACPYQLTGHALEEWNRTAGPMWDEKILTKSNVRAWACYCIAYGRHADACDECVGGLTLNTDNGGTKANPAASIAMKSLDQMVKYLAMFGLTPNPKTPADQTAGDPFDLFLRNSR